MAAPGFIELPNDQQPTGPVDQPQPEESTNKRDIRLYVATPCFGCQVSYAFAASIVNLQAECARRGIGVHFEFVGNESLVERARNILTAKFLESDGTHLMFIDADIGFDPEAVVRLLDFDKSVVSAVYPKKAINWANVEEKMHAKSEEPVHQMGIDFNINIVKDQPLVDGFARVLDTATGFLMIKRHVIEEMYEKYRDELFAVNDLMGQNIKDYVAIFACMIDPESKRFLSEDFAFCRRYQQMGGEIWACTKTPLTHVGISHFVGDIRQRFTYCD